jgi:hypothetical protein
MENINPIRDEYSIRVNEYIKNKLMSNYPAWYDKYYKYIMPFTNSSQDFGLYNIDKDELTEDELKDFDDFKTTLSALKNSFQ